MSRAARFWATANLIVCLALLAFGLGYYILDQYDRAACFFLIFLIAKPDRDQR